MNKTDENNLSVALMKSQESDFKRCRKENSYQEIPESYYERLSEMGKRKYRAIVVSTIMSGLWDGWKSRYKYKTKYKRIPNNKVMLTRRMLHQHFGMAEATAGSALHDLVSYQFTIVATKPVFSGLHGKNLGTSYRLPWMENVKGKRLYIYWGLLVSEPFLTLPITLQAILILLHSLHYRRKNRLTIKPSALEKFDVHRNRLMGYVDKLRHAGLLEYVENDDYKFTWFDMDSKPSFNRLKLITMHSTHTGTAPNSYQGRECETY